MQITCPDCLARARGYTLEARLSSECRNYEDQSAHVLADFTQVVLDDTWRQRRHRGKRPAIWQPSHRLRLTIERHYGGANQPPSHIYVHNRDHKHAESVRLCDAPDTICLTGPGAQAQIERDAPVVAAAQASADRERRQRARLEGESREGRSRAVHLIAALASVGIEVHDMPARAAIPNHGPVATKDRRLGMSLDVAARVAEALGAHVSQPPSEPMSLWRVWYGETKAQDREPLYVAARTREGVIAYMTGTYCHERRPDGDNIPLKAELLIIEPAGPDPEVPEETD